MSEAESLTVQ